MTNTIFPRKLKQRLNKEIETKQVIVITGMRQVGKTTLITDIFNSIASQNKLMLDLENPFNRKLFEEVNYDNILQNLLEFNMDFTKKAYLFLDEIQFAPGIVSAVKYLYDHNDIKFFLTGSSSYYLKNLFPESLAGRKVVYELYPLDFEEFIQFKGQRKSFHKELREKAKTKKELFYEKYKALFNEFMFYGGFPAVVLERNTARKKSLIEDIIKSYFEKDIKTLADFRNMNKVRDLILLLAARTGSKMDITKISQELAISRDTVNSYLNFLEQTYFVSFVKPFTRNINGEVRGASKVYLCDTGILSYLGKISEGPLFENAVFNLLKTKGKINYYEKYKGPELDFVLNGETGLEVKIHPAKQDFIKAKKIAENLGLKNLYIVSRTFSKEPEVIIAMDL